MPGPLVSILVPTFDYGHYLDEAVRSALAQTVDDIEVVVVDNASTDTTGEVAYRHALADRRVRYVRNPTNIGGLANWDRALGLARGEYVKYLFADDVLEPHCVEALLAPLEADPEVMLSFSHWARFDDEGTEYRPLDYVADRPSVLDGRALVADALCRVDNVLGCPSSVLFRRRDLAGHPGFARLLRAPVHVDAIADFVVFAELAARGWCAYTPEDLTRLRQHGASWTAGANQVLRFQIDWPRAFRYLAGLGLAADPRVARTFVATITPQITKALTGARPAVPGLAGLLADLGHILELAGDAPTVPTTRFHRPVLVVVGATDDAATVEAVAAVRASTHRDVVDVLVAAPRAVHRELSLHLDDAVRYLDADRVGEDVLAQAAASGRHEVVALVPDQVRVGAGFAEDLLAQARSGARHLKAPAGTRAQPALG